MLQFRWLPTPSRLVLGLIAGGAVLGLTACTGAQSASSQAATAPRATVSCPPASKSSSGTFTASGGHFVGDGLDVTAVASLDPNYGVNGTIDILVTVSCPAEIRDVGAGQSYEAFGSTVGAHLSEVAHNGNTWTLALFADNLSGSHPFEVALYRNALSGSGQPPFATIVFNWPKSLVKHMAN